MYLDPRVALRLCAGLLLLLSLTANAQDVPGNMQVGTTLQDFYLAAIEFSPRLRIAEESLNLGTARKDAARGALRPQLNANASISDNRRRQQNQLTEFDGERYSLQLTQILFNWQAFAARDRAGLVENQLEAEYYFTLSTVLTDVADRYFSVLQAQDALASIASELDAVNNQLDQIQSLFALQLAPITDLRQAQARLSSVQAQQIQLESELALARETLRSVTGLEVGQLFTLDDATEIPVIEESIQYWVQLARENNQQIEAGRFALQAAEKGVSESKGAYLPQVTLIAQQQDSNVGFDNRPVDASEQTYLGLNVSVPLYSSGVNRSSVRQAMSQRSIAQNQLRQVELGAAERVRSAYLQAQSSNSLTDAAESLVEATSVAAEAMQEGFALGAVTNVDVLIALRDRFQAERDLQSIRYDHIRFLLFLKQEAGTLTAEDLVEVGNWLIPPGE